MSLTEFLLARIAEDEAEIANPDWATLPSDGYMGHAATWGRPRALAECEAKRLLIQRAESLAEYVDGTREDSRHTYEWTLLRLLAPLALTYADHPDYDEEWRP